MFCSFSLARNIAFSVRWLPSELNPADAPSRANVAECVPPQIQDHFQPHSFSHAAQKKPSLGASQGCRQPEEQCRRKSQGFGTGHFAHSQEEQGRAADKLGHSAVCFSSPRLDSFISRLKPRKSSPSFPLVSGGSSSSSWSSRKPRKRRERTLVKRSKHRLKKYVDEAMEASSEGLSLVERKAIGDRTLVY